MNSIKKGFVFSILILSLFACLPLRPAQGKYVEFVGTVTIKSWVPVYVLYDPPGGNSSARLTISAGVSWSISFDTDIARSEVDTGVLCVSTTTQWFETPRNAYEHIVVARKAAIEYNRYLVVTPRRSYYKLEYFNVTHLNEFSSFQFSELGNYGMYLERDLTSTPGPYSESVHIPSSSPSGYSFKINVNVWVRLGVGFKVKYSGTTFKAGVLIGQSTSESIEISHTYYDKYRSFDVLRYYNAKPITGGNSGSTTLRLASLIWFSE